MTTYFNSITEKVGRMSLCLYGDNRIGKTTSVLKVAYKEPVIIMSADQGVTVGANEHASRVDGRLMVLTVGGFDANEEATSSIAQVRAKMRKVGLLVNKLIEKGTEPNKIWFVQDSFGTLQQRFLTESRTIALKGNSAPMANKNDRIKRDVATLVDFGILNGWTNEIIIKTVELPCNVVFVVTEKYDEKKKLFTLNMQGQSAGTLKDMCDIVARMEMDTMGRRSLTTARQHNVDAGSRSNRLAESEKTDLIKLRNKYLGIGQDA